MVDGVQMGTTGDNGQFAATISRVPGKQVTMEVTANVAGTDALPWKNEFIVRLPNEGEVPKYVFQANLNFPPYMEFSVLEKGAPIAEAIIKASGAEIGKSDANGKFMFPVDGKSKKAVNFDISKNGYSSWQKSIPPESGKKFEVALVKRVSVKIDAQEEEYGRVAGVAGVTVTVDGRNVGKTSPSGTLIYTYDGEVRKKAKIVFTAPAGYLPKEVSTVESIGGDSAIRQYFYPVSAKPIKVSIYKFVGNTPGADMKDVLAQAQNAMRVQLFKRAAFREVPEDVLVNAIKKEKLNFSRLSTKGWQGTQLQQMVDMIVLGSMSQDDKGYFIEVKFHASTGKLLFSQIVRASSSGNINGAVKDIVENVVERFPFEANVTGKRDDRFEINVGDNYSISRGNEFEVMPPIEKKGARTAGARLVVKRVSDSVSLADLGDNKDNEKIAIGDRVVRRIQHDGDTANPANREFVTVVTKGSGSSGTVSGVNIYLNNDWVGTTDESGRVDIPVRTGKSYNLMLYRHGYQQVTEKFQIAKSGDRKEYQLAANTSTFNLESTPSNATAYLDGEEIGKTPISGKSVDLGFHTLRVSAGEGYRDFEEVVEFNKKVQDLTGAKKVVLYRDYMKIGEQAEAKGNVDEAIAAYKAAVPGHPDYSNAHHRLAQLYLDEKDDFDGAIREFENVLSLPENEQLVFKQFSVAYTNLGHAYYGKGDAAMNTDRNSAAQYFGKALQNLKIAKQNTRFFPKAEYDEAIHDTHFYTALSLQKLYMITKRPNFQNDANLAWRDYFDFFPASLLSKPTFEKNRETAKTFWEQIKE
jgi:tetratricopeptide (TPR) repeat protein